MLSLRINQIWKTDSSCLKRCYCFCSTAIFIYMYTKYSAFSKYLEYRKSYIYFLTSDYSGNKRLSFNRLCIPYYFGDPYVCTWIWIKLYILNFRILSIHHYQPTKIILRFYSFMPYSNKIWLDLHWCFFFSRASLRSLQH